MTIMAALIFFGIIAVLAIAGTAIVLPLFLGFVFIMIANLIGKVAEVGIAPIPWDIYTVIVSIRCSVLIGSNILFEQAVIADISTLVKRYIIVTIIAFAWWVVREALILNKQR